MSVTTLYTSRDLAEWSRACSGYGDALASHAAAKNKPELVALDKWLRVELPPVVRSRSPPHVTQVELSRIVRWKLMMGKVRPNLQKYADEANPALVKESSLKSFALCDSVKLDKAFSALVDPLKGVGPATASAILGAYTDDVPYCFDEVLLASGEAKDYSMREALSYTAKMRQVAHELNHAVERDSKGSTGALRSAGDEAMAASPFREDSTLPDSALPAQPVWTAKKVALALFSAAHGGLGIAGMTASSAASSSSCATAPGGEVAEHPSPRIGKARGAALPAPAHSAEDTANHQSSAELRASRKASTKGLSVGAAEGSAAAAARGSGAGDDEELASPAKRARK